MAATRELVGTQWRSATDRTAALFPERKRPTIPLFLRLGRPGFWLYFVFYLAVTPFAMAGGGGITWLGSIGVVALSGVWLEHQYRTHRARARRPLEASPSRTLQLEAWNATWDEIFEAAGDAAEAEAKADARIRELRAKSPQTARSTNSGVVVLPEGATYRSLPAAKLAAAEAQRKYGDCKICASVGYFAAEKEICPTCESMVRRSYNASAAPVLTTSAATSLSIGTRENLTATASKLVAENRLLLDTAEVRRRYRATGLRPTARREVTLQIVAEELGVDAESLRFQLTRDRVKYNDQLDTVSAMRAALMLPRTNPLRQALIKGLTAKGQKALDRLDARRDEEADKVAKLAVSLSEATVMKMMEPRKQ